MIRNIHAVTRRRFTMGVAVAPLLLAQSSRGEPALSPARGTAPKDSAFTGKFVPARVQPFAAGRVQLREGPFKDAQTWNAAFLKRQSPDRLVQVFRVNAGIPTDAAPLGGWEAPNCELRGHFVGITYPPAPFSTRQPRTKRSSGGLIMSCRSSPNARRS